MAQGHPGRNVQKAVGEESGGGVDLEVVGLEVERGVGCSVKMFR